MDKKYAFLFPGQGAQYVGMGKDFYDQFSIARETFQEADEALSFSLSKLIFEGPGDELIQTKKAQIAIYVASFAMLRALSYEMPELVPAVCAGLSLGEYTALCASSRISFIDGLRLVQLRGQYMQEACEKRKGTMRVVLGMDPETIAGAISLHKDVWVANLNCPGQVVIAGSIEGIEVASEVLKTAGAKRVLPLDVSGAFHSGLMESAREKLEPEIALAPLAPSTINFVMNVPGDYVYSLDDVRHNLIQQVTSPVLWEKGIRAMADIDCFLEIGPGKTLSGMNRKIGVSAPCLNLENIQDLETIHATLTK